ncbi:MAG: helix-turn-helix domain-containing protein [Oscillospiraceae bacterium]|nr:helix-turn-helix domain-containing protein [Oscillospiraceae bacterium]
MAYPYTETGERILNMRKARGLTREKLAEMADISVQFLADIEKGRKNMTVTTLRKLAGALMVTTDSIVNGTESLPTELETLCRTVPPEKQDKVAALLRLYLEAIK